ncbi:MAG: YceI family protein, partial [Gammaproteobacteria bacterium]
IAGTRRNMLGDGVLDAGKFPEIRLTSRRVTGKSPDYVAIVAVELKGGTRELTMPVHVEQTPGELRVTGDSSVSHAALGLTPFSVMGGLLSVRDEIRLRFRIVARPQS